LASSSERSALEARVRDLERRYEAAKAAYQNAPADITVAKQRMDEYFAVDRELREARRRLGTMS
jgi:outer membrane murein-binding lipoprotein Lpp